jgi:hypothetical protein
MLITPITAKVLPMALVGLLATVPIYDMAKIQKDNTSATTDQTNGIQHRLTIKQISRLPK